jgi:hypothetical protein
LLQALNYLSLLNRFSFDPPGPPICSVFLIQETDCVNLSVYLGFFVLVGLGLLVFFILFWIVNRVFTRLQSPPKPNLSSYLSYCSVPSVGVILGLIPAMIAFGVFFLVFQILMAFEQINEQYAAFDSASNWAESKRADVASLLGVTAYDQVSRGRLAVVLGCFGLYMCFLTARNLIPHKVAGSVKSMFDPLSQENNSLLTNQGSRITRWYRTQYVFAAVVTCMVQAVIIEYSFSNYFKQTLYDSLLALIVFNHIFQAVLEWLLDDSLLAQPFMIAAGLIEMLTLMGSNTFLEFMQCFVIYSLVKVAFRIFFSPGMSYTLEKILYLKALFNRYIEISSRRADMEEGDEDDEEEDLFDMDFQGTTPAEYIIKMLTMHSTNFVCYLVFPIVVLFVWWAEGLGLQVGAKYGIRTSGRN